MGPVTNRIPRVVRFHYDADKAMYRVVVTALDETPGNNQPREFISFLRTLAEVIIFIVNLLGSVSPTYIVDSAIVGAMGAAAAAITDHAVNGKLEG